jgi:hypothetical protein
VCFFSILRLRYFILFLYIFFLFFRLAHYLFISIFYLFSFFNFLFILPILFYVLLKLDFPFSVRRRCCCCSWQITKMKIPKYLHKSVAIGMSECAGLKGEGGEEEIVFSNVSNLTCGFSYSGKRDELLCAFG